MPLPSRKPVLIVEDDADIRESLKDCLESEGYAVSTAANGELALALLVDGPGLRPGIILLDMMMPVMDGVEFVERLLAREAPLRDTPIAVISAGDKVPPVARAFFKKPFDLSKLLTVVREHCA